MQPGNLSLEFRNTLRRQFLHLSAGLLEGVPQSPQVTNVRWRIQAHVRNKFIAAWDRDSERIDNPYSHLDGCREPGTAVYSTRALERLRRWSPRIYNHKVTECVPKVREGWRDDSAQDDFRTRPDFIQFGVEMDRQIAIFWAL